MIKKDRGSGGTLSQEIGGSFILGNLHHTFMKYLDGRSSLMEG